MSRPALCLSFCLAAGVLSVSQAARAQELPVPVVGHAADVSRLAGVWEGGYASDETGRQGTLRFELAPGATHAFTRLVMLPAPTPEDPAPEPVVLTLHLVEVDSATVRGVLRPYDDPEWDLPLETHFLGTLGGDGITGAFDSLPTRVDTIPTSGRWWATRQRPLAPEL